MPEGPRFRKACTLSLSGTLLPLAASITLGAALLVPLRDDRRGRRATVSEGADPLYPQFVSRRSAKDNGDAAQSHTTSLLLRALGALSAALRRTAHSITAPSARQEIEPRPSNDSACYENDSRDFTFEEILIERLTSGAQAPDPRLEPAEEKNELLERQSTGSDTEQEARASASEAPAFSQAHHPHLPERSAVYPPGEVWRAVPLTRAPLRPAIKAITWPALTGSNLGESFHEDRLDLLRAICDGGQTPHRVEILCRAYNEECGPGRTVALRGLCRYPATEARQAFIDALRAGSDEERSLAIDGLAALDLRDPLVDAFNDRVEAIAAKAVLACARSRTANDIRAILRPHVDETRVESILALLAGIVE